MIRGSVHQAQLSVTFETVFSSFPRHFPCSLLCEHREEVQQCCGLLFTWWSRQHHCWRLSRCLQQGRIECTRVSFECEIPVVKVFAWCVRLWLSDSHVLWARFRHRLFHRSHSFSESRHCCVHRSAWWLLTHFNHLCRELVKLTSQHLDFLSRCNISIPQYQEWINIPISGIPALLWCKSGKRRTTGAKCAVHKDENCFLLDSSRAKDVYVWDESQCQVYCDRLWCDLLCKYITQIQQASSLTKNVSMKKLPNLLHSLQKSHLIVRLSTFQTCQTSVWSWDCSLYFWWNANCPSNLFFSMNADASNVEDIHIPYIQECSSLSYIASCED